MSGVAVLAWSADHTDTPAPQSAAAAHSFPGLSRAQTQWELLNNYCLECHNATDWAGGLALDTFTAEGVPQDAEVWEKVVRKLRGGLMPPPGEPRPENQAVHSFVSWMESYIDHAAAEQPEPGHVALHRLNRKEYANAIKYLLDFDVDPVALLPQDDVSDGFDNIAKVLQVSPSFLDQYLAAARIVAVQAVGNPRARPAGIPYVNTGGKQHTHVEGLPLGTRGGMMVEHTFPADGEYELNVSDIARALWVEGMEFQSTLIATLDGVRFYQTTIGGEEHQKAIDQQGDPAVDAINKRLKNIRFQAKAGQHEVAVTFVARSFAESDSRLTPLLPGGGEERVPKIASIEIRGPFTTHGVSETASRRRIFTCYPQSVAEETPCAQQILGTIARRAYRRPVTATDMEVLMQAYARAREGQSFDEGIRGGLTRLLASPHFLYRAEPPPAGLPPGAVYQLTDLQLASRLSFFLWGNVPDDELLALAEQGRLKEDAVLEQQIVRMLADPKAGTLASNFAFQWLGLGKLADIEPDPAIFPYAANHRDLLHGDPRDDMRQEIVMFVDSIFRENRSVLELMTGKHTYLNERLALHYGIDSVKGDRFRRVELQDSVRWGLLGKAGVLMASSYPNRTAPVLRGAWILENITGTPPTPPPPNVEALKENEAGKEARTMRELMAAHSANKSCHACHGVLDPLGLALENFDGVGRWRDRDRFAGTAIDASANLPDGTAINGPDDLRNALIANPDQFVQTLTQKLMTYATGRTMEYRDMPTVRAIVREAATSEYRFIPLVTSIVKSPAFRMQRSPEVETKELVSRGAAGN